MIKFQLGNHKTVWISMSRLLDLATDGPFLHNLFYGMSQKVTQCSHFTNVSMSSIFLIEHSILMKIKSRMLWSEKIRLTFDNKRRCCVKPQVDEYSASIPSTFSHFSRVKYWVKIVNLCRILRWRLEHIFLRKGFPAEKWHIEHFFSTCLSWQKAPHNPCFCNQLNVSTFLDPDYRGIL